MSAAAEYVRQCPTCGAENAPETLRCACGALLAGVDLVRKAAVAPEVAQAATGAGEPAAAEGACSTAAPAPTAPISPGLASADAAPTAPASAGRASTVPTAAVSAPTSASATPAVCPYNDCGQSNPPGSATCLYCNRPLAPASEPDPEPASLLSLPTALREDYRIVRPFPAAGAEAEILLVEPVAGGPQRVAKIYRSGIRPRAEVQERIARIDPRHRVEIFATGLSDGHAWELMEFCQRGSLRERLRAGPLPGERLRDIARELAIALADVHAARLVHRDLKPENILIRSDQPLDLVLTDFGTASPLDATQRFTGTARTLHYAAPETVSGVIDGKADYWALGMLLLEAALGRHPFAGLSEAVILHHLTTRSIDLAAVADGQLKQLLRGLLRRDPKARWGHAEIERWQAGDPGLADLPDNEAAESFPEPYRLRDEACHTPEQLAVALARHWPAGVADLNNGQLLDWFRSVVKDHNSVRLLLDLRHERQLHVDLQLLKLILHLAPGIPPVWRGESIELRAILTRANAALKGDADAAQWLDSLYRHRVLEAYAEAGNADAAAIVERWSGASERFAEAWSARLAWLKERMPARDPGEIVYYDDVVYGRDQPDRPSAFALHPRLLAAAYVPAWADWLRRRLQAEIAGLAADCSWLAELGDPEGMAAADLLVLEALLPQAKKAAERTRQAQARREEEAAGEFRELRAEAELLLASLRRLAGRPLLTTQVCAELRAGIERYRELLARVRTAGRSDAGWQEMRRTLARNEPVAGRMLDLVQQLTERRAVNNGWLSREMVGLYFVALFVLPRFLPGGALYLLGLAAVGVPAWRLLPNWLMARRIRKLGGRLG